MEKSTTIPKPITSKLFSKLKSFAASMVNLNSCRTIIYIITDAANAETLEQEMLTGSNFPIRGLLNWMESLVMLVLSSDLYSNCRKNQGGSMYRFIRIKRNEWVMESPDGIRTILGNISHVSFSQLLQLGKA